MSENNAHLGETCEQRLKRFTENHPIEVIDTVIQSTANYFVNELRTVFNNPHNRQTTLMFIGTHSIALTIAHGLFGEDSLKGYKMFLEHFIDGDTPDTKFSSVAAEIHEWRNILAHRWINVAGHSISYNFEMDEGWVKEGKFLVLNPQVYLNQFLKTFGEEGRVYQYNRILTSDEMYEEAKKRFISKYKGNA